MLGAGFMQGVAIRAAKSRGWRVTAVDGNPRAACAGLADRFEPIDLKDVRALVRLALDLKEREGLDGVFTAATDFSASVAAVAEACSLPGHSLEAARNASDKVRMRARFAAAGVPSPRFTGLREADRARAAAILSTAGIAVPLVVKPADNMGARGCRLVASFSDLDAAIADAIRFSRTGTAIVEEYMDGPEFSVEALVFDGAIRMTGFADRHIFFPPYFIEMGHTIPTSIDPADAARVIEVFERGVRALGLTHGAAKGDVKLTSRGPMIGEIAGRLSGGYMSGWTFPYSSGVDLTGAALSLCVGERPSSLDATKSETSAERAWISIPGKIASVSGLDAAQVVPFVRDVFPRLYAGDPVVFPTNNVEKCGNVLAAAPSRAAAIHAAEEAARAIVVRLAPHEAATDDFLSSSSAFPPSAFILPQEARVSFQESLASGAGFPVSVHPSVPVPVPREFSPYLDSALDWQGRTMGEAIRLACALDSGLVASLRVPDASAAKSLWRDFLRGGIQGMLYRYDSDNS